MSQKWSYNGQEFEVDLQDAIFSEKYEQAFERLGIDEKKVQKEGSLSSVLRGYCNLFFHLFDDIYGPGTSEQLFGGKVNAGMCDEAYSAFLDAAKRSNMEAGQARAEMLSKYKPTQNRAQRRSGEKK